MEWIKKHVDTVIVLGGILGCMVWIDGKFEKMNDKFIALTEKISCVEKDLSLKISYIEKDLSIIKTILIIKGIMPPDLIAKSEVENEKNVEKS